MSDDEFLAGYMDGLDPNSPEPSDNRSHRYRHSFGVARREGTGTHWPAAYARERAREAEAKDQLA